MLAGGAEATEHLGHLLTEALIRNAHQLALGTGRIGQWSQDIEHRANADLPAGRGGVLHPGCAQGEPGARGVSLELLDLLQALWDRPAGEILAKTWPADSLRDLRLLLVEWLQFVLERRFFAAGPMEREFAASVKIGP